MTEKPDSHKRALRRHHDKRKKAWVRKTLGHYFMDSDDPSARRVASILERRRFAPVSCAGIPGTITMNQPFKSAERCSNMRNQSRKTHKFFFTHFSPKPFWVRMRGYSKKVVSYGEKKMGTGK